MKVLWCERSHEGSVGYATACALREVPTPQAMQSWTAISRLVMWSESSAEALAKKAARILDARVKSRQGHALFSRQRPNAEGVRHRGPRYQGTPDAKTSGH